METARCQKKNAPLSASQLPPLARPFLLFIFSSLISSLLLFHPPLFFLLLSFYCLAFLLSPSRLPPPYCIVLIPPLIFRTLRRLITFSNLHVARSLFLCTSFLPSLCHHFLFCRFSSLSNVIHFFFLPLSCLSRMTNRLCPSLLIKKTCSDSGKKRSLRLQNNHKKQNQCFLLRALE